MQYDDDHARNEAMRAWAKGIYPLEAGVELLCRTDWGRRLDVAGWVEPDEDGGDYAWPRVADYLSQNYGTLSGGERRQLELIASILGQHAEGSDEPWTVLLNDALVGIDASFIRLFMAAVWHTAGLHESTGQSAWRALRDPKGA